MSDAKPKTRRPRGVFFLKNVTNFLDEPLTQQRLPAWQPILSPLWVFCGFFVMLVIFLALGIVILVETLRVC